MTAAFLFVPHLGGGLAGDALWVAWWAGNVVIAAVAFCPERLARGRFLTVPFVARFGLAEPFGVHVVRVSQAALFVVIRLAIGWHSTPGRLVTSAWFAVVYLDDYLTGHDGNFKRRKRMVRDWLSAKFAAFARPTAWGTR